ncbi:p-hydroxycinnamoyl-CoA synthetase [Streptomyces albofaciens JCM 4342]|uniref:acyl-CoA synthetase n=1 Tax=Streptomyces albofaciens TaxID=66866 RepID=UPI00123B6E91|nr:long-chain fatty acid--CoA ligase [Streptomyces albofaciens]KAA6212646.1 p-hydroxycinnamoyl-CoA synthetase [Streptomyces albofaciens JCM 4342]
MDDEGIGTWALRRARRTPHRTALVHDGAPVSYAGLYEHAARIARVLREHGVHHGDRVGFLGPNRPGFLASLFAAGLTGAVFVPFNVRLTPPELAWQLADCGARVLLRSGSRVRVAGVEGVTVVDVDEAAVPNADEAAVRNGGAPRERPATVAADDPCLILYTSGTTGRPKGAVLSHANLTWNAVNVLIDEDLTADEVALVAAPLYHAAALGMQALPVLLKGGTCVLMEYFDAGAALGAIERHRVTSLFGVPTMFRWMADHPRWPHADLSSLRTLVCGGAPVPEALTATYAQRGLTLRQGYGLTEAAPGVLLTQHGRADAGPAHAGAPRAGVPHFFTDVRVAAPGPSGPAGADPAAGRTGELLVRGPNVMTGYWNRPRETEAALADGWLRTGDVAHLDADGGLTVMDRLKEVIISGGENVYPAEVEHALLAHPDVADCAVIPVPDAEWGEVSRAVLVAAPGVALDPEAVLASLRGRLAAFKIPRSAVIAPDLPRTGTGKAVRRQIQARYGSA